MEVNPAFGLVVFPDLILPERDVGLVPLAVLVPVVGRGSSVMPPPTSTPVARVRAATVAPTLSGDPPSIGGQPPLLSSTVEERSVVGGKTLPLGTPPSSPMKLVEDCGGVLELLGFEELPSRMDVDKDEAGLVSAKGPRAKRRRAEDDEAESEGGDEPKVLEVRKGKGKGKEKEKEKQTAVKEVGVKKGKVKVSYMRSREGSFIEIIIFVLILRKRKGSSPSPLRLRSRCASRSVPRMTSGGAGSEGGGVSTASR